MSLKVCDITQFWSPVSGGVRRYVGEKVRYLRKRGWQHVLIIPGAQDAVHGDDFARVYEIASPAVSRVTGYRVLLRLQEISRILAAERPDVVECGDPYQVGSHVADTCKAIGIPACAFYHSHFAEADLRPLERFIAAAGGDLLVDLATRHCRRLYNRFARTLVPSPILAQTLRSWGVENTVNVDLGVDPVRFRPGDRAAARHALGIGLNERVLLSVGRLAAEKNTSVLCEAFHELAQQGYRLLITGEGLQRGLVEQLARHAPDLRWEPFIDSHETLLQWYHAADLFIHPGVKETFGLVSLEAQACGLPVCGFRGTPMDRIIAHTQDFWASENNGAALAQAVRLAFTYDLSALGCAARASVARRFSWQAVFARQFDLYQEIRDTSLP